MSRSMRLAIERFADRLRDAAAQQLLGHVRIGLDAHRVDARRRRLGGDAGHLFEPAPGGCQGGELRRQRLCGFVAEPDRLVDLLETHGLDVGLVQRRSEQHVALAHQRDLLLGVLARHDRRELADQRQHVAELLALVPAACRCRSRSGGPPPCPAPRRPGCSWRCRRRPADARRARSARTRPGSTCWRASRPRDPRDRSPPRRR